jgi:hypothetical protein
MDVGDYIGPITVPSMHGRHFEKGMQFIRAKRDIHPGELLLVEKALFVVDHAKVECIIKPCFEDLRGDLERPAVSMLTQLLVNQLQLERGGVWKEVRSLYAGPSITSIEEPLSDQSASVLTERVTEDDRAQRIVNMHYRPLDTCVDSYRFSSAVTVPIPCGIGLWAKSALFKCRCLPNAVQQCFGDVIIVYACKPINKGDHVTVDLVNVLLPMEQRQEHFRRRYLTCDCALCSEDRKEDREIVKLRRDMLEQEYWPVLRRKAMFNEDSLGSQWLPGPKVIRQLELFLTQLRDTYGRSQRRLYHVDIFEPMACLASLYHRYKQHEHAAHLMAIVYHEMQCATLQDRKLITSHLNKENWLIPVEWKPLPLKESSFTPDRLTRVAISIAIEYFCAGNSPLAREWVQQAHLHDKLHFEGVLFDERYAAMVKQGTAKV